MNDCGCRKGAIRPYCPRHDPARRHGPLTYRAAAALSTWSQTALAWMQRAMRDA